MGQDFKQELLKRYKNNHLLVVGENSMVSITDRYGRITHASDCFCEFMELTKEKIIGESLKIIESHLHSGQQYKELWKTIKKGMVWKGILPYEKNKITYYLDTVILPVKDERGVIIEHIVLYQDVLSQWKTNRLSKHDQEQVLKSFSHDANQTIYSVNREGDIINVNNGIDGLGISIYEILNPRYNNEIKKHIDSVFANKRASKVKITELSPSGTNTFFTLTISPVFNNKESVEYVKLSVKKYFDVINTATEKKPNLDKYHTVFKSTQKESLVLTDKDGIITDWNKGAEIAFGYNKEEVIGNHLEVLFSTQKDKSNLRRFLRGKKLYYDSYKEKNLIMTGVKKGGKAFPVEFSLSYYQNGKKGFFCAMLLDISKRRNLEKKLKQKKKDLELFLYRSAHDLKAPFTSAEGLLNLIKEEPINDKVKLLVNMLDSTLERGRVLSDNLALASVISNKKEELSAIDFSKIVEGTLQTLNGMKNFSSIQFQIDINQTNTFFSNKELLSSLFQNLIQNAISYSKPVSSEHMPCVRIQFSQYSDRIELIVEDNGVGISKKDISKIFNLYYRVNSDLVNGNGLGLYIVKNIVEDLSGDIKVSSELGKGTCFEVALPIT